MARADAIQARAQQRAARAFYIEFTHRRTLRLTRILINDALTRGSQPYHPPTPGREQYLRREAKRILYALTHHGPLTPDEIRKWTHATMLTVSAVLPALIERGDVLYLDDGRLVVDRTHTPTAKRTVAA